MTDLVNRSRERGASREPTPHLFHVGQLVRVKSRVGVSPKTAGLFRITGTMPARDNSPQYRIRNDGECHERVATEDSLEPVTSQTAEDGGVTLIERTFRKWPRDRTQQPRTSQAEAGESPAQAGSFVR